MRKVKQSAFINLLYEYEAHLTKKVNIMKIVNSILLFGYIGAVPSIPGGAFSVLDDWQWWAMCAPFWVLIFWRDAIKD